MSRILIALLAAAGIGIAGSSTAQMNTAGVAAPISEDAFKAAKKDADAQYKLDKEACSSLSANAKDICVAQAKGRESMAKADAEAAYKNTPKSREEARVAHAQASYHVAIEKCDDVAGNPKDVCVKEAKAGLVKGKSEAKVDRVAADTRKEGAEKRSEARSEASEDTRNAQYKVAIEKCDTFSGGAKDGCVSSAKAQFGKS